MDTTIRRRGISMLAAGAFALTVISCGGKGSDGGDDSGAAQVDTLTAAVEIDPAVWGACDPSWKMEEPFTCSTISVPLDYEQPTGETITIALARYYPQSTEPTRALLVNPGGPGGSGLQYLNWAARQLVDEVDVGDRAIVGFDPRGVGQSSAVRCLSDAELDLYNFPDTTPDTPEETDLLDKSATAMSDSCIAKYGEDLYHYSTENTARDMEMIRRAMGLDSIDYLGVSYGTYLGGVFATMFPGSFSAMVLDAAFDPQGDTPEQELLTQAEGFEEAMNNWIAWCEDDESGCQFDAEDVGKRYDDLYTELDETPAVNADGRLGNQSVLSLATIAALYSRDAWPILAAALESADSGNPAGLFSLADNYNERAPDGTYSNADSAGFMIRCASGFNWEAPDDPADLVEKLRKVAPRFSRDTEAEDFETSYCDGVGERPDIFPIKYRGEAPVVVIGGTDDPATPFRWSEEMTDNMGSNAVLVTFEGEGHGQTLGSRCINDVVGEFFRTGDLPDKGTKCQPDEPVPMPEWWTEIPAAPAKEEVLDAALLGPLVGLSPTDGYAEFRAVPLSQENTFNIYSAQLRGAGFVPDEAQGQFDESSPSFFLAPGDSGQYLGVFIFSPAELAENGLSGAGVPIPANHSLLVLYFLPR